MTKIGDNTCYSSCSKTLKVVYCRKKERKDNSESDATVGVVEILNLTAIMIRSIMQEKLLEGDGMNKRLLFVCVVFAFLVLVHISASAQTSGIYAQGEQFSQATAPTPPVGQTMRYIIPYFASVTPASGSRLMTAITVNNQSTKDCTITIEFQRMGDGPTVIDCTLTATVSAGLG